MLKTTYTVDIRPHLPFHVLGNRYQAEPPRDDGHTLILLHATGLHKETWEPVIQALFDLSAKSTSIREAWAIECPNHGRSAVLNAEELANNWTNTWEGDIYPRAAHAFMMSGPGGVRFTDRRLIVIGHSMGGASAVLLTTIAPKLPVEALILLDATLARKSPARDYMDVVLAQLVWAKPDVWRSRKDARRWFAAAPGYKTWDAAIRELFVEYALKAHPASKFPHPFTFKGLTLACDKSYEAACYRAKAHHDLAWEQLQQLHAHGPPVHMILSEKDEFDAASLKQALLTGEHGGGAASVQHVENTTHMFPQQRPEATARAIWTAIQGGAEKRPQAKL